MASSGFTGGFNLRKGDTDAPASNFSAGAASGARADQKRRSRKTLKAAQKPTGLQTEQPSLTAQVQSMKHGGRVRKTGLIYAHRGEVVIPAKMARRKARGGGKRMATKTTTKP
jgi:hypothetical protein